MKDLIQESLLKFYKERLKYLFDELGVIPMGGTALGVLRHKGFIPWDDDMDFFITPKNFKLLSKKNQLILLEPFTRNNSLGFCKVLNVNFVTREKDLKSENITFSGIDLMILCEASSYSSAFLKFYLVKFITLLGVLKRKYGWKSNFFISFFLVRKVLLREVPNKKYVFHATGRAMHSRGIYPARWFDRSEKLIFENSYMNGFKGIDQYLRLRYGKKYLSLPDRKTILKYKSHSDGYIDCQKKTILIDGVGVFWNLSDWERNELLIVNEGVLKLLSQFPGNIIVCTNLPLNLIEGLQFQIFTTEGTISKLNPEYFQRLFMHFEIDPLNSVYIEHDEKACKVGEDFIPTINWSNDVHPLESLVTELPKLLI